jgi:hypothetical protein
MSSRVFRDRIEARRAIVATKMAALGQGAVIEPLTPNQNPA